MSQKSEKYARSLDTRMTSLEHKLDRWEQEIASSHLAMLQDASRERSRARREADTYRRAARGWKAVACAAITAAAVFLTMVLCAAASAAEQPKTASAPSLVVLPAPAVQTPQEAAAPQMDEPSMPAYTRIIENATVTHYCICEKCCGKAPDHPAYGITASGRTAVPGYSVAVDPALIELGSTIYLDFGDGELMECRADDTGGAVTGAHIDLCVGSHQEALNLGVKTATVYIKEERE